MNRNMHTKGLKAEDTHSQAETLPSSVFPALHQMSDSQAKNYKAREELRKNNTLPRLKQLVWQDSTMIQILKVSGGEFRAATIVC